MASFVGSVTKTPLPVLAGETMHAVMQLGTIGFAFALRLRWSAVARGDDFLQARAQTRLRRCFRRRMFEQFGRVERRHACMHFAPVGRPKGSRICLKR